MSVSVPKQIPSISQVNKAGDILRSETSTTEQISQAMKTLSLWRQAHGPALNTFQAMLRGRCKSQGFTDENSTVAQRMKRLPSIIGKLCRKKTRLSKMQDIAGLRVILPTVPDVRAFHEAMLKSPAKHEPIVPADDYINKPKKDGYRSLHQVFRYRNPSHPELDAIHVEVQIRTQLQHAWATAVETIGVLEHSSFKSGDGSSEFKRFFKLSSALISHEEKSPILEELQDIPIPVLIEEFVELERRLKIFEKLRSVTIAAKHVSGMTGDYTLMFLDTANNSVSLTPFDAEQSSWAEDVYSSMEERYRGDETKFLVLVSVSDLTSLKKAYPNYFLSTTQFINTLQKICNSSKRS